MHGLILRLVKPLLAVLALLATGCGTSEPPAALYMPAPPQADPRVEIVDFSYTPPSTAHPGDSLRFTVTLNMAAPDDGWNVPRALIGSSDRLITGGPSAILYVDLEDDGLAPDAVAGDGIWTGDYTLPEGLPPQSDLPVTATFGEKQRGGLDLTIL